MIICTKCKVVWSIDNLNINASCPTGGKCLFEKLEPQNKTVSPPPVLQKTKHFAASILKHLKNKGKTRTEAEVKLIYDKYCSTCEYFENNECLKCGCPVVRNNRYRNKLKWDSEHCPINKW